MTLCAILKAFHLTSWLFTPLLPLDFEDIAEATVAEDKNNRLSLIYCYTAFKIIASLWN